MDLMVARRRLIDDLRRENRITFVRLDDEYDSGPAPEYGPRVQSALMSAFHKLGARDRRLLRGKLLRGRTFRELADEHECSVGAIKMRYSRALEALRRELVTEDFFDEEP